MDAPLGEERELYSVTIDAGGVPRVMSSDAPRLTLPPGTVPNGRARVAVRQRGTLALSAATESMIEGDAR